MNIGIVGTGYVGLITSVCFAHLGHTVIGFDKRQDIIDKLSKAKPTIYEEGLEDLLQEGIKNKNLQFTTQIKDLATCDIVFLAVGTPPLPNGNADLSQVFEVTNSLLHVVCENTMLAVRSTIPVGTMSSLRKILSENNKKNHLGFCPEFLREGIAVSDFLHPHRVVIASDTEEGQKMLQQAYAPLTEPQNIEQITCESFETAELIKYASNVFLATKITFTNQIAQLAQHANADIYKITQAMGLDTRIGSQFLQPGPGYGGSCFPKDTMALAQIGLRYGIDLGLVEEVHKTNIAHQEFVSSWIIKKLNEKNIHASQNANETRPLIAVWGLTFKANTDDVRDSPALNIINNLVDAGFAVCAYDPQGTTNFIDVIKSPHITTKNTALDIITNSCALVTLTEWKEFSKIPAQDVNKIINNKDNFLIFDTRNILNEKEYKAEGLHLYKLGVGTKN